MTNGKKVHSNKFNNCRDKVIRILCSPLGFKIPVDKLDIYLPLCTCISNYKLFLNRTFHRLDADSRPSDVPQAIWAHPWRPQNGNLFAKNRQSLYGSTLRRKEILHAINHKFAWWDQYNLGNNLHRAGRG